MVQKTKSSVLSKIAAQGKKAFEAHKTDETKYAAGGSLPDGIENGIAQLKSVKFDEYKSGAMAGKLYFQAVGIVVSPKIHAGIPIEGLRTMIQEPLCDTPTRSRKTIDDHMSWILNELRKLGVDTSEVDFDNLEATCSALEGTMPTFRFRTWKGKKKAKGEAGYNETYDGPNAPEPRVNEEWNGAVEYSVEDSEDEVQDNTEVVDDTPDATEEVLSARELAEKTAEEGDEGIAAVEALNAMALEAGISQEWINNAPDWSAVADAIEAGGEPAEEGEAEPEEEAEDPIALGEAADSGDQDSGNRLVELAEAAGIENPTDADTFPTWGDLASAVAEVYAASEEEPEEEPEPEEEAEPEVEGLYYYKPKGAKKAVEVEVVAVFAAKKVVNIKNLEDGKTIYKSVPYDQLALTK